MVTKKERELVYSILLKNKLKGEKPSTITELATQFETTRTAIYYSLGNVKPISLVEAKIKEFIKENRNK